MLLSLSTSELVRGTHWIGGLVGPKAGLPEIETRSFFFFSPITVLTNVSKLRLTRDRKRISIFILSLLTEAETVR
jgi:hypothetical protein